MSGVGRQGGLFQNKQRTSSLVSIPQSLISSKKLNTNRTNSIFNTGNYTTPPADIVSGDKNYQIAESILHNTFKKVNYKEYANYLGSEKHYDILKQFISLLKPFPFSLLTLLNNLSNQIYFIAEAQNIDRILEELSKQFIDYFDNENNNPQYTELWHHNYKMVHIVLFSLLLMNSDLHNEENIKHHKKSKESKYSVAIFLDNTLFALKKEYFVDASNREIDDLTLPNQDEITEELTTYFELIKHNPLSLCNKEKVSNKEKSKHSKTKGGSNAVNILYPNPNTGQNITTVQHSSGVSTRSRRTSMNSSIRTRSPSLHSLNSTYSTRTSFTSNSLSKYNTNFDSNNASANWKFHNNIPLSNLFQYEPFDAEFVKEKFTYWYMDGVIKVAERYNKNKTKNKDNRTNSGSYKNDNTLTRSVSNSSIISSSTIREKEYENKPNFKNPHKVLLKFFRKSKKPTIFDEVITPIAFLNKNTTWARTKIRISEGRIFIFKLFPSLNISTSDLLKIDDIEEFKRLSSSYMVYNLFNAIAELVQENVVIGQTLNVSNIIRARGNFMLSIPDILDNNKPIVLEFQTDTVEEAQLYVESLNFWAARLTPVPSAQFELVSNDEYGWSDRVLSHGSAITKPTSVSSWVPLLSSTLLYNEEDNITDSIKLHERIHQLTDFTNELETLIDQHNDNKPKLIKLWSNTMYFEKVMDNWNKRYLFLNKQFEKTSVYLKSLNKAEKILPK